MLSSENTNAPSRRARFCVQGLALGRPGARRRPAGRRSRTWSLERGPRARLGGGTEKRNANGVKGPVFPTLRHKPLIQLTVPNRTNKPNKTKLFCLDLFGCGLVLLGFVWPPSPFGGVGSGFAAGGARKSRCPRKPVRAVRPMTRRWLGCAGKAAISLSPAPLQRRRLRRGGGSWTRRIYRRFRRSPVQ